MKYYVDDGSGEYTDCFSLKKPSLKKILVGFSTIDRITAPVREALPASKRWSVLTLSVSADGRFKADYEYKSHDSSLVTWEKAWKKKHLKQ